MSHSFAPRYLYYMHYLHKLSALCTKALKCLNKSVLWRVGNVDFCMHFGDAIYTCLHSKCWCLHCLNYHVQLLALAACHFGIGRQKKNVGLTGVPLPLCCFGALAQANKLYLLTGADKSVYEKTWCIHRVTY